MRQSIAFTLIMLLLAGAALQPARIFAQSGGPAVATSAPKTDKRAAAALYQEAANYAPDKFKEFAATKVPFNPKFLEKTLKDSANGRVVTPLSRHAEHLAGEDFYFLECFTICPHAEGTLDALKKFLAAKETVAGEKAQDALHRRATRRQNGSLEEAEERSRLYRPRAAETERASRHREIARLGLPQSQTIERHRSARRHQSAKQVKPIPTNPTARDFSLYTAGTALADVYAETKKD